MRARMLFGLLLGLAVWTGLPLAARAADPPTLEPSAFDRTPPRLSFTEAQVSFWRPGASDWIQAQVNTPLAPGDELATGSPGNLEIQIGARAFVRAWANSQLGLATQEPDFLQFTVTAGHVAFDLRTLEPGQTVEVDTPNAVFTIEHPGFYRVDVAGLRTAFITRRAGRATLTPAGGETVAITPSEEVVVEGTGSPQIAAYAAPPLDVWDTWNYARTDRLLDAVSARYVAPGTYGVSDLDPYGSWRVVPTYGAVWVPTAVPTGWVPYSTGAWILDPVYGWTWVDTAPWGWAPYHYGRWVFVDGFWAWAPGPVVVRPVYAPALVAFLGDPGAASLGVAPVVGWVALGWGEPCVPWWGGAGVAHVPSWRGWGGPRVVNNVVINTTTVVNVQTITVYRNTSVPNAVVVIPQTHFGQGLITAARLTRVDAHRLQPIPAVPQVAITAASVVPTVSRGLRPPEEALKRPVVAIHPPHVTPGSAVGGGQPVGPAGGSKPGSRLVAVSPPREPTLVPSRPPLGPGRIERPMTDRAPAPSPPRPEGLRRPEGPSATTPPPGGPVARLSMGRPPLAAPTRPGGTPPLAAPVPPARPSGGPQQAASLATPHPPGTLQSATRLPVPYPPGTPPVTAPAPPGAHPGGPQMAAPAPQAAHSIPAHASAPPPSAPHPPGAPPGSAPMPSASRPGGPHMVTPAPAAPQAGAPQGIAPPAAPRANAPHALTRPLPGEPANRLAPGRLPGDALPPGKPGS